MTRHVTDMVYCAICSYPPEYCEFAGSLERCKGWLKQNHQDLYQKLYPDALDAVAEQLQETKLEEKPKQVDKKKKSPKVIIETQNRGKRKHVTIVSGMETVDPSIDLKKLAKQFAGKFACGSGVSKNAEGKDEIVIQGEFADDVLEILEDQYKLSQDMVTMKEAKK